MYRKNTASQFLCVQLLLTATGAVATGLSPAARRCIDGTFAAGGGSFTEDGSTGSYKYALAQADTNGNDISIIVTAAGAIPVCVNFVTTAADPTDSVRFGLTALPNAAAEAAGGLYTRGSGAGQIAQQANGQVDANVSTIKTQAVTCAAGVTVLASVGTAATSTAQTGDNFARLGAPAGASVSADVAAVKVDTAAIKAKTDNLPAAPASTTNITAGTITTATNVTTVNGLAANVVTAASLAADAGAEIADAILDRDMSTGADSGSTTVRTPRQALRFLRNKWDIAAGTLTVKKEDDATTSWTSAMSTDAAAVPIIGTDPAGP